jgi:hypothetical protein
MKYSLSYDITKWPSEILGRGKTVSFNVVAECNGEVKFDFYKRSLFLSYVNIPLFLTELGDFLTRVNENEVTTWAVGFAPFAHGLMVDGHLLISSRSDSLFLNETYDDMGWDKLAALRAKVEKDVHLLGRVLMNPKLGVQH